MDGYVVIGTELDTKKFDAQIEEVESKLNDVKATLKMADEDKTLFSTSEIRQMKQEAEKLENKLIGLRKQQEKASKSNLPQLNTILKDINKSMARTIRHVGRWVLGIFAIESAYGFVRRSMSTLAQYNEQIKTDIDYISFAMATSLQPLVEKLISLAYTLLNYVNYIAQAWFGVDLFANASADAMNRASKSAQSMKKSLAGFDEMNVLNDNGSTGAMGAAAPSVNLQAPENVEPPAWLVWIAENKDLILGALGGITTGLLGIKLGLTGIQGLGIGIMIMGIILLIENLKTWIDEMGVSLDADKVSWETLGKTLVSIGLIIGGLALLIGNVPLAVAAAAIAVVGLIASNWDKIRKKGYEAINWIRTNFGYVGEIIATPIEMALDIFEGLFRGVKQIVGGIIQICKGDLAGGLKTIFRGIGNVIIGVLNAVVTGFNGFIWPIRKLIVAVGKVTGKNWDMNLISIPKIPYLKTGGIINMPGRGVPVGAMAGEAGREGVIPLTDEQAMEQLGYEIAKHIRINLTNEVMIDRKRLARIVKEAIDDSDFAFNS